LVVKRCSKAFLFFSVTLITDSIVDFNFGAESCSIALVFFAAIFSRANVDAHHITAVSTQAVTQSAHLDFCVS
jgi:hypothetical protein